MIQCTIEAYDDWKLLIKPFKVGERKRQIVDENT